MSDKPLGDRFLEAFHRGDRWEGVALYMEIMDIVDEYDFEAPSQQAAIDARMGSLSVTECVGYIETVTEFVDSEAATNPAATVEALKALPVSLNNPVSDLWKANVVSRLERTYGLADTNGPDDEPPRDFWTDRGIAFAADDARAELGMDEMSDALHDMLGEESARRQWLKEATLTGELELPGLDDLAPLPESDEGPDLG